MPNWHERLAQPRVVRGEIAASRGGTLLRVTHRGLAGLLISPKEQAGGWPGVLEQLKNFIEK